MTKRRSVDKLEQLLDESPAALERAAKKVVDRAAEEIASRLLEGLRRSPLGFLVPDDDDGGT
jgi:hypothetical protein